MIAQHREHLIILLATESGHYRRKVGRVAVPVARKPDSFWQAETVGRTDNSLSDLSIHSPSFGPGNRHSESV